MKPRLAITIGDPAGIGPELALRCAADPAVQSQAVPIVFGDLWVLQRVAAQIGLPMPIGVIESKDRHELAFATEPTVLDFGTEPFDLQPGVINAQTGQTSYRYVTTGIDAAIDRDVDALVTGPIQKEAWHRAGIAFPGHTEVLTSRTGVTDSCMLLTSPQISCALVTVHIGLAEVASELSEHSIHKTIKLASGAMSKRLGRPARVGVCALNPHAGEAGIFGDREEQRLITPAINQAADEGILVTGPLPSDTAFVPQMREQIDVYVCMYHDQGLIPLKTLAFDEAVNVTLGLPIIRTSVDHGTALDIAWQGTACNRSMLEAIHMARSMVNQSKCAPALS